MCSFLCCTLYSFCLVPFVHLRCAGLKCVSCTGLSPQYGDAVQERVLGRPSCYPLKVLLPFLSCLLCFVFVVYKPAQYSLLLTYFIEGVAGAGACPLVLVPGLPPRLFEEWAAVCFIVAGPFLPVLVSLICLYLSSVYLFVVRDARDHLDSRGRMCLYAHGPGRWPRSLFTSPPNRPGVGTRLYEKPSPGKPGINLLTATAVL